MPYFETFCEEEGFSYRTMSLKLVPAVLLSYSSWNKVAVNNRMSYQVSGVILWVPSSRSQKQSYTTRKQTKTIMTAHDGFPNSSSLLPFRQKVNNSAEFGKPAWTTSVVFCVTGAASSFPHVPYFHHFPKQERSTHRCGVLDPERQLLPSLTPESL